MSGEKNSMATQTKRPGSNWESILNNFYSAFLPYNQVEELQKSTANEGIEFEEAEEEWEKDTTIEYAKSSNFYNEIRQLIQQSIQQAQASGQKDKAQAFENVMTNFDKIAHTLETEIKSNKSKEEIENLSIQLYKDLQATIKSITHE